MSGIPRVVFDTNAVLSSLVFKGGRLSPLREASQRVRCLPLASHATVAELIRALGYPKFRLSPLEQEELLADYIPFCTVVRIPAKPPAVPRCRDPFDRPFLQLAKVGRADYLVTGDALLALGGGFSCPIVAPSVFLHEILGEHE